MRTFWIVQSGIGAAGIAAFTALGIACSGNVIGGGSGSGTDSGSGSGSDTGSGSGTCVSGCDTGTDTLTAGPCAYCACGYGSSHSPPGCLDLCDNTISGGSTLNFCTGGPALAQCKACIAARCGVSDLTQCN